MAVKNKGSNAERELVKMFHSQSWSALRIAGSGRMNFPCGDLLAGNGEKILAIECKATKKNIQYLEPEQIEQLKFFAANFGARPLVAVKFSADWHFFDIEDLEKTKGDKYVIHKDKCLDRKKTFSDLVSATQLRLDSLSPEDKEHED